MLYLGGVKSSKQNQTDGGVLYCYMSWGDSKYHLFDPCPPRSAPYLDRAPFDDSDIISQSNTLLTLAPRYPVFAWNNFWERLFNFYTSLTITRKHSRTLDNIIQCLSEVDQEAVAVPALMLASVVVEEDLVFVVEVR